jgi:hypothetical protein
MHLLLSQQSFHAIGLLLGLRLHRTPELDHIADVQAAMSYSVSNQLSNFRVRILSVMRIRWASNKILFCVEPLIILAIALQFIPVAAFERQNRTDGALWMTGAVDPAISDSTE